MYTVVKVTDLFGQPSKSVGADYTGGVVLNCQTTGELADADVLYIGKSGKRDIRTSTVRDIGVQSTLFGPETVEVRTRNTIYHLEAAE